MSLVEDQSLYSGLTSKPVRLSASTKVCNNASKDAEITPKNNIPDIKVEDFETGALNPRVSLSTNPHEKARSFDANSWINTTFFNNDIDAAAEMRSRSCGGQLETCVPQSPGPSISREVLIPKTPRKYPSQNASSIQEVPSCKEASNFGFASPSSPGSPNSPLSDDGDTLFETPKASTQEFQDQCTPLTPPSAYGASESRLGKDIESPTRPRRQRPAPSPIQPSKQEAESESRGRSTLQQTVPDETRLRDTSAQSWDSIERSRSRTTWQGKEGKEFTKPKLETKVENETADDPHVQNDDCPTVPSSKLESNASSTLVKGTDILDGIFGADVIDRYKAQNCCVGWAKQANRRCNKIMGPPKVQSAHGHFQKLECSLPLQDCIAELQALGGLIACYWHLDDARKKVATWLLENQGANLVREARHELSQEETRTPRDVASSRSPAVKSCLSEGEDTTLPHTLETVKASLLTNFDFGHSAPITKAPKQSRCKTSLKTWVPWQPQWSAHLDVKATLVECVTMPLVPREGKKGYLYIYRTKSEFGIRKIGVTNNIEARMNGWRNKCKREITLVYPTPDERASTKHVYRLEKLVHAELKDYREAEHNCGCKTKRHREWFRAEDPHIMEVVRRWTEWIQTGPYEKIGTMWQLKEEERKKLDEICTPYAPLLSKGAFGRKAMSGNVMSKRRVGVNRPLAQPRRSRRLAVLHPRRSSRIAAAAVA